MQRECKLLLNPSNILPSVPLYVSNCSLLEGTDLLISLRRQSGISIVKCSLLKIKLPMNCLCVLLGSFFSPFFCDMGQL